MMSEAENTTQRGSGGSNVPIVRIIIALVVMTVIGGGAAYFLSNEETADEMLSQLEIETTGAGDGLVAAGFIEAEELEIAAELGGRVVDLSYEEGDEVEAGEIVVAIDTSLLEAQREIALAQIDLAEAQRDLIKAGVRDEVIEQAEAQVALAEAAVSAASVALGTAATLRDNPQDLRVQVIDAETQVAIAAEQAEAARLQFSLADENLVTANQATEDLRDFNRNLLNNHGFEIAVPLELGYVPYLYQQAEANLLGALDALEGTHELLGALVEMRDNPQAIQAQVISANTQLETAKAQLEQAKAELANLQTGARSEDIAVADAQVEEAEAALEALDTQIERMTIAAPMGGIVLEQAVHVGELAVPTVPLITLANLDEVELTVFLSAVQFDQVELNQHIEVTVDSFPDRVFEGTVIQIADEAEFTPRNVQTREERVNLVYAIKILIENPDHALKPGMPADAHFE